MSPRFTVTVSRKQESIAEQNSSEEIEGDSDNFMNEVDDDDDEGDYDDDDDDDDEIDIGEVLEDDGAKKPGKRKAETDDEATTTKKKKKKTTVSRGPPTVEEMTRLRETETLFHSNLFRLQIEELLREVRTKKKERRFAKLWLEGVMKHLAQADPPSKQSPSKKKVKYPLPKLPDDPKETEFKFEKPVDIKIIGSFASTICIGPEIGIDVAVYMPKSIFAKDDHLNARYLRKRAHYLCRLAAILLRLDSVDQSERLPRFCLRHGSNPLTPVLAFCPAVESGSEAWAHKVTVYLHAVPAADTFKPARFVPEKNNVRPGWWNSTSAVGEGELTPTPNYNNSIARDIAVDANDSLQKQIFEENHNLRDAVLLLRVWLRQRQLDRGWGSFNGHLLSMYLIYLLRMRRLNAHMSSYQVMRNTWLAMAQSDWLTTGPSLCDVAANQSSAIDFHRYYQVVFVDSTGFLNLAADLSRLTYLRVKEEAELALKYLENPCLNSFQVLFLIKMPFLHQFDHIFRIKNCKTATAGWTENEKLCPLAKRLDHLLDARSLMQEVLSQHLLLGLGRRVDRVAVDCANPVSWPVVGERGVEGAAADQILVGLRLNAEHAMLVMEKGPEANLPEAIEFRALWGERSELRRYQDGNICEAVVWDTATASATRRRLVTRSIVDYLLQQKLMLAKHCYTYLADQVECVLVEESSECDLATAQQRATAALDSLARLMLDIDDLPLTMAAVQGTSPLVRHCAAVAHSQTGSTHALNESALTVCADGRILWDADCPVKKAPPTVEPIDAVIQLGLSKKWPDDLAAIRRIKAAFYIELANKLCQKHNLIAQPFPQHLIVWKDNYAFRLRVVYQQEIGVMKAVVGDGGVTAYKDNDESLAMDRDLVHLPLITSVLAGLSKQQPAFGASCALAKRWLRAHMVDAILFPDVAVELLVAQQYAAAEPFTRALQPQAAFLRLLAKLATCNWCAEPQLVNFNGEMTRDDISEIEELFRTGKELGSAPALVIATNYDKTGSVFTRQAPILPILYHVAKIAKASLDILENQLMADEPSADYKLIFRPPLDFFDWLISIDVAMNPSAGFSIDAVVDQKKKKKKKKQNKEMVVDDDSLPLIDFSPVACYLQELRTHYDEMALFFHDQYGGSRIGVLLKPSARQMRDFKVSHFNGRKPIFEQEKPKLVLNEEAILEDFKALGKGIVKDIVVNKK